MKKSHSSGFASQFLFQPLKALASITIMLAALAIVSFSTLSFDDLSARFNAVAVIEEIAQ
jgi:hypothetical protein